jgi:hypothetical protein
MDEIELFTTLQPSEAPDLTAYREGARARLAAQLSGSGARGRIRRFASVPSPGLKLVAASGAALAVGGAVVLPSVLSPGPGGGSLVTSAWAVQASKDGTIKVTIKDASDPAGLQRALRAAGVSAIVVSPREISVKNARGGWVTSPSCRYRTRGPLFSPPSVQRAVVTLPRPAGGPNHSSPVIAFIHPAAMPPGSVLFIVDTFSVRSDGSRVLSVTPPAVLRSSTLPRCERHPMPVPIRGGSPVPSGPPRPVTPTATPFPTPTPTSSRILYPTPVPTAPSVSPSPVPTRTTSPSSGPTPVPSGTPSPTPRPTRTVSPEPTPTPS